MSDPIFIEFCPPEFPIWEEPTEAAAPAKGIHVVSGGDIVESTPRINSWLT